MKRKQNEFYSLPKREQHRRLREIAMIFFKLGSTAFGGPAAHVAMMEDELVTKRKWLSKDKFLDLYGATNLLPGPNSTELAIHLGLERGGWRGLVLAGSCFILPAMFLVTLIAELYTRYGTLPELSGVMYGIKPVIIAILLQALIRLGQSAIKNVSTGILGALVIFLFLLGMHELLLLFGAGILMMLLTNRSRFLGKGLTLRSISPFFVISSGTLLTDINIGSVSTEKAISLSKLFLIFLKIGSVLYGSGYVLLAFLESEFVEHNGVLTNQHLLDAISVGQITPGPVFTTATFIGYLIYGGWGGVLATIGIFLPAFVLVGVVNPFISRLRSSSLISGLLDGINAASWGLMAVVSWKLAVAAVIDFPTILLTTTALFLVFRFKINSAWLVLGGGLVGFLIKSIH